MTPSDDSIHVFGGIEDVKARISESLGLSDSQGFQRGLGYRRAKALLIAIEALEDIQGTTALHIDAKAKIALAEIALCFS